MSDVILNFSARNCWWISLVPLFRECRTDPLLLAIARFETSALAAARIPPPN